MQVRKRHGMLGDDSGGVTVEAVLWMPVFVFFLVLIFDVSMVFLNQSQILRVMQDANRSFAVGQNRTLADTQAQIVAGVRALGGEPTVSTAVTGNVIRSEVVVRAGDLGGVGLIRQIANVNMRLVSQHMVEG